MRAQGNIPYSNRIIAKFDSKKKKESKKEK